MYDRNGGREITGAIIILIGFGFLMRWESSIVPFLTCSTPWLPACSSVSGLSTCPAWGQKASLRSLLVSLCAVSAVVDESPGRLQEMD
jgi:hypothetical protein